MKTYAQIRFDFNQARRRADEIEEIASAIANIAKRDMENDATEIAGAWRGDSARQFHAKTKLLQSKTKETATELNSIAATIREIARRMYEAEMSALQIAEQRNHGGGGSSGGGGASRSF